MTDLAFALRSSLTPAISAALLRAVADPAVPIDASGGEADLRRTAEAISADALEQARLDPLVQHATNGEPWYRSRVTWGAILSGLTPLLALAGWTLTPDDRELVVGAVVGLAPLVAAGLGLYGRWRASRPIGS